MQHSLHSYLRSCAFRKDIVNSTKRSSLPSTGRLRHCPVIIADMADQTATPVKTEPSTAPVGDQNVEVLASSLVEAMIKTETEALDSNAQFKAITDRLNTIDEWLGGSGHEYRPAVAMAIMTKTRDWERIYLPGDQQLGYGAWTAVMFGIR